MKIKTEYRIKLIFASILILYMYYMIYYVNPNTQKNKKIKKIINNKNFLFIITIIVILGMLNIGYDKQLHLPSQLLSFLVPMTLIVIDI